MMIWNYDQFVYDELDTILLEMYKQLFEISTLGPIRSLQKLSKKIYIYKKLISKINNEKIINK